MAFGTADRLKSDVAEGVARVVARTGLRRAGKVGLLTFGAAEPQLLAPRGGRRAMVGLAARARGRGSRPTATTTPRRSHARCVVSTASRASLAWW